jgi:Protein of unknown function (DUF2846)
MKALLTMTNLSVQQSAHFSTRGRRSVLGLALAAVVAVTGCATANGPSFSKIEPAPAGKSQLYLYRKSAIYAMAASYTVANVGTKQGYGELFNASYLVIPLDTGKHVVSVDEKGWAKLKTFEVLAEAGKNYFVEYDSSRGLLLGAGLLSGSTGKTETEALADLKDLKRAN